MSSLHLELYSLRPEVSSLRLELYRIAMEAMPRGEFTVDDAHQFVHHQEERYMSVNRMNRPRPTRRSFRPAPRQSQYHSSDLLRKRPYCRWIFRRLLRIKFLSFRQPVHLHLNIYQLQSSTSEDTIFPRVRTILTCESKSLFA